MDQPRKPDQGRLDTLLDALANPVRRRILERIARAATPVTEIAQSLPVSRPAVSQHLKTLKLAGLVDEERRGRRVLYRARLPALSELGHYLSQLAPSPDEGHSDSSVAVPDAIDHAMSDWTRHGLTQDPETVATIVRLLQLAGIMERLYAETAAAHGMTQGDVTILGTLRRSGIADGLTPSEIATAVLLSRPDITRRLGRLESAGMIERRPVAEDQRSYRVHLTKSGEAVVDAVAQEQFNRSYRIFFELPAEQRLAFDRVLRQLLAAMAPVRQDTPL